MTYKNIELPGTFPWNPQNCHGVFTIADSPAPTDFLLGLSLLEYCQGWVRHYLKHPYKIVCVPLPNL